jgi:hypothetical protein
LTRDGSGLDPIDEAVVALTSCPSRTMAFTLPGPVTGGKGRRPGINRDPGARLGVRKWLKGQL